VTGPHSDPEGIVLITLAGACACEYLLSCMDTDTGAYRVGYENLYEDDTAAV